MYVFSVCVNLFIYVSIYGANVNVEMRFPSFFILRNPFRAILWLSSVGHVHQRVLLPGHTKPQPAWLLNLQSGLADVHPLIYFRFSYYKHFSVILAYNASMFLLCCRIMRDSGRTLANT